MSSLNSIPYSSARVVGRATIPPLNLVIKKTTDQSWRFFKAYLEEGDIYVGLLNCRIQPYPTPHLYICMLRTQKAYQSLGVGSILLQVAIEYTCRRPFLAHQIKLNATPLGSLFFSKRGFNEVVGMKSGEDNLMHLSKQGLEVWKNRIKENPILLKNQLTKKEGSE